jgi:hypothetical protein
MTDPQTEPTAEEMQEAEMEVVDLIARLLAAAKDLRGHSPSRRLAHGNCAHCRATVQGAAFVQAMMADDAPAAELSLVIP